MSLTVSLDFVYNSVTKRWKCLVCEDAPDAQPTHNAVRHEQTEKHQESVADLLDRRTVAHLRDHRTEERVGGGVIRRETASSLLNQLLHHDDVAVPGPSRLSSVPPSPQTDNNFVLHSYPSEPSSHESVHARPIEEVAALLGSFSRHEASSDSSSEGSGYGDIPEVPLVEGDIAMPQSVSLPTQSKSVI